MSHHSVIELYTELATNPDKDFGWENGLQNARNHNYHVEWLKSIPEEIWRYCAAVGNPFSAGEIRTGDTVLDIGCGAGVDLCVAALLVGDQGQVFGIDVTPAMVTKARHHASLAMSPNITVSLGSMEALHFKDSSIDTVISNGAINLADSKENVFAEIYRVLKHHGHLYFSDMIKDENNPEKGCCHTESWADCVAGTLTGSVLVQMLQDAGFTDVHLLTTNHYKTSTSTVGATFSAKKA